MDEQTALKYFGRENYRRALEGFLELLEEARKEGDKEKIAHTSNFAALCLYFLHQPEDALDYFEIALKHTEGADKMKVQANIDEVNRFVERIKKDIEEIENRLENETDTKNKGILLSNLGLLHYLIGHSAEAEKNLKAAEKIFRNMNNSIALGAIYTNLALLYDDMRQLDYLHRALDIFEEEGHIKGQIDTLHALALYYLFEDSFEEAYYFVKKELALLDHIDNNEIKKRAYELAADLCMELGKVDEGMKFTEMASKL